MIKNTSSGSFHMEIVEQIRIRNKLFKKIKSSCLNINWKTYKETRKDVQRAIKQKKNTYFQEKLSENITETKELWQTLKSLGLANKNNSPLSICLKNKNGLSFY